MDDSFTPAGSAFAVISPCSKCMNQLSEQSADGKPFCPRRKWQADQATFQTQNNGNTDPRIAILAAFGTEGTPQEGDGSLRNPVYLDNGNASLVWIATLRDNSGIRDASDNVIAPSILDPSFIPAYTPYIHCRQIPYIPAQHEASYRTTGALKEGDTVIAITAQNQQNYSTTDVEGDSPSEYRQVLIEGVVNKVNLVYATPRTPVDVDHVIQGS